MALIRCSGCNKEYSDQAKKCPHCGLKPPILCTECGKEVNDKAKKCPNCGAKIKEKDEITPKYAIEIIILSLLLALGSFIIGIIELCSGRKNRGIFAIVASIIVIIVYSTLFFE